jgi:hypothetical protein
VYPLYATKKGNDMKLDISKETLEGIVKELEAHVAPVLLKCLCPNYQLVKALLVTPEKKTMLQRLKEVA